eukprot:UN08991
MSYDDGLEHDYLNIRNDKNVLKMLHKYGDRHPLPEIVILSTKLWKINRKGKAQKRVLLLTNKAIYNVKPNKLGSCRRRIMIGKVASVTSSKSHEFTINIPAEYDYRYKSVNATQKSHIITTLAMLFAEITGLHLNVHNISKRTTIDFTLTKVEAKQISGEEKYQRRQKLTACENNEYNELMRRGEINSKIRA